MKKLVLLLSVVGLLALLVGCNSPVNNNSNDPIVGTWNPNVSTAAIFAAQSPSITQYKIVANADKSATLTITSGGTTVPLTGSWSLSGTTYSFTFTGMGSPLTGSLSGSTLTISGALQFNKS